MKPGFQCSLTTVIALLSHFSSVSQNEIPYQRRFTTADGLSHNDVRCMTQDQFGFLWIGTWDGLCRYDGFEFKRYNNDPDDPNSFPYSQVIDIATDRNNVIWISSKLLCRYNRETDDFTRVEIKDLQGNVCFNPMVETDTSGNLFVFSGNRIFSNDQLKDTLTELVIYDETGKISGMEPGLFCIDEKNNIWIVSPSPGNIYKYVFREDRSRPGNRCVYLEDKFISPVPPFQVSSFGSFFRMMEIGHNRSLILSNFGLYVVDEQIPEVKKTSESDFSALMPRFSKPVWWCGNGEHFHLYYPLPDGMIRIPMDQVSNAQAVLFDRNNNLWIGEVSSASSNTGLLQSIFHFEGFSRFPAMRNGKDKDLAVFALYKNDRNEIWMGVKDPAGILMMNEQGVLRKAAQMEASGWNPMHHPRAFLKDQKGQVWVGYLKDYLKKYNPEKKDFENVTLNPDPESYGFPDVSYRFLALTKEGYIVTGGYNTVMKFDPDSEKVIAWKKVSHHVYSAYVDDNDRYYLGATGYIHVYDRRLDSVDIYKTDRDGLFNIESICRDDSGNLWLGLLMGGICKLNLKTRKADFFTTANGLANNTVYNILRDKTGKLWISTDAGISVFNPATGQFFNYDESNGLPVREFNSDAAFRDHNGQMLFGGMGGVVAFHPEQIEQKFHAHETRLLLTDILARTGAMDQFFYVYDKKELVFSPGTRNLQVTFSCIDYQNQEKIHFRYRMAGMNDEWQVLKENIRTINLMALDPGKYDFELEATDLEGNWTKKASLKIEILHFFYETIWFRIFVILFLLMLAGTFIYMRFRQVRLRQEQRISQLRLITIQGQMNPHFLSNSLAAAETFIATKDTLKANEYLGELRDMMREAIDFTGKNFIPLTQEISFLKRYLKAEQIRLDHLFDFEIITGDIETENWIIAPAMVQPFAENAIRYAFGSLHGKKGFLVIKFEKDPADHFFRCSVDDNGIGHKQSTGLHSSSGRRSHGTGLILDRLEIFNKLNKTRLQFRITELYPGEEFPGTHVEIQIPCKFASS